MQTVTAPRVFKLLALQGIWLSRKLYCSILVNAFNKAQLIYRKKYGQATGRCNTKNIADN